MDQVNVDIVIGSMSVFSQKNMILYWNMEDGGIDRDQEAQVPGVVMPCDC